MIGQVRICFHLVIETLFGSKNNQPAIPDYGWVFLSRNQDTFDFKFNVKFTPTYPAEQMFPSRNRIAAYFKSGLETPPTKIFSFYLSLELSAFPSQPLILNFTLP